jgi:glycine/D-amino acid oxidase-like deaminating enzyme
MTGGVEEGSEVLVVGAGVVGCHVARELAADYEVTVLDRGGIAEGATALAAGLVAPTLFYGDYPAVARTANEFFREFDGTAGFSFTERPRLDFVKPPDEGDAREQAATLADEGFPVQYRDVDVVAADYPQFNLDDYAGAVLYGDTGWVDPFTYATALQRVAMDRGATFETDVEVTGLRTEDGRIDGVDTADGSRSADAVVVAAGWRTEDVLPDGVDVPVRPYRTQCVVLEPDDPLSETFPIGRLGDEHFYFRPEHNGDLLVGGGQHICDDPVAASGDADEEFKMEVAAFVPDLIDGFETAGFVNGWAGIDAATPDARPVIDRHPDGPAGLVVATGFNGLGVMLSPVAGPLVRWLLEGAESDRPVPHEPFAAERFEDLSSAFELRSTSEI